MTLLVLCFFFFFVASTVFLLIAGISFDLLIHFCQYLTSSIYLFSQPALLYCHVKKLILDPWFYFPQSKKNLWQLFLESASLKQYYQKSNVWKQQILQSRIMIVDLRPALVFALTALYIICLKFIDSGSCYFISTLIKNLRLFWKQQIMVSLLDVRIELNSDKIDWRC